MRRVDTRTVIVVRNSGDALHCWYCNSGQETFCENGRCSRTHVELDISYPRQQNEVQEERDGKCAHKHGEIRCQPARHQAASACALDALQLAYFADRGTASSLAKTIAKRFETTWKMYEPAPPDTMNLSCLRWCENLPALIVRRRQGERAGTKIYHMPVIRHLSHITSVCKRSGIQLGDATAKVV